MHRRSLSWVVVVALGLAVVFAASARSAASPFELVFTGRYEPLPECEVNPSDLCFDTKPAVGTFTSSAPFCGSGGGEDVGYPPQRGGVGVMRRYTCADGSGSLTLLMSSLNAEITTGSSGAWGIVEGSGRFEGLRGSGTYTGELLGGNPADLSKPIVFRTVLQGIADADTTPPRIGITSARATKLRREPGSYLIRVDLSLRDDVEENPVTYSLKATEGPWYLDSTSGTTASASVSATLHVLPSSKRVRSITLHLLAADPIGNEQLIVRPLRLPR